MIEKYVDAPQAITSQASREMGSNTPYYLQEQPTGIVNAENIDESWEP
jgi:hypothetical protein